MKQQFYTLLLTVVSTVLVVQVFSQANTALSNLVTPTAINRDLSPGSNNTLNLGVGATNWKNIYIGGLYYLKNLRIMHAPGTSNFFAGPNAGNLATTGTFNAGVGNQAMELNTTGSNNTALGYTALRSNTLGGRNVAVGLQALYNNTSGGYNTAMGERTMYLNKTGIYNTAIGSLALYTNGSGANNSALGYRALYLNTTGSSNVAIGTAALYSNTTASNNVAIGDSALSKSTDPSGNIAVGSKALFANTIGYNNAAVGFQALYNNTTGRFNDASGYTSLYSNTTGSYNTAAGVFALYSNQSASYNSAFGYNALFSSTTAFYNSAFGSLALNGTTTGGYNTAVGRRALEANTTGTFNTAIGYDAGPVLSTLTNSTALGNGARPTASNQIWLGNTSVNSIRAAAGFVIMSDGRFKKDLKDNVPGLEFIKLLKPMTYTYDIKGLNKKMSSGRNTKTADRDGEAEDPTVAQREAIDSKEKITYTGLIAQDVEEAAKKLQFNFSGVYKPENENDVYGLSYSEFVMPLIKSVQELSSENDSLKQLNNELITRLEKIESLLKIKPLTNGTLSSSSIDQNSPNPFKASTIISYNLPQQGITNAQIVVYDAAGKKLKMFNLPASGRGNININASTLPPGVYHYSLFVNGSVIDTKKMVLVK